MKDAEAALIELDVAAELAQMVAERTRELKREARKRKRDELVADAMAGYIKRVADAAPPLAADQQRRLVEILSPIR